MATYILLYDGVCGLCNRLVHFVLRRDRAQIFRFASLQGRVSAEILKRQGENPGVLDTVYVVINHERSDESLLTRSDAVIFTLKQLPGIWPLWATTGSLIPRQLRDALYRMISRNRYRIFGRYDTCPTPPAEVRDRFLDQ